MAETQALAVNVFENPEEIIVVAAMPGIEPEDIMVQLHGPELRLTADARGEEAKKKYLSLEWSYGPYDRRMTIPMPVDCSRANVAYGNGVLTIVLPKSNTYIDGRLMIPKTGQARGLHQGHSKEDVRA